MNHIHQKMPLNLKSLRTRFALKFIKALKKINQQNSQIAQQSKNGNNLIIVTQRCRKVKVAAEASLASAVRPRRAWTRAILRRTWPRRLRRHALARRSVVGMRKQLRGVHVWPGDEGQAEELRKLVPGGEDMDMQCLLNETAHYVKCLATQVKVMRTILTLCSTNSIN